MTPLLNGRVAIFVRSASLHHGGLGGLGRQPPAPTTPLASVMSESDILDESDGYLVFYGGISNGASPSDGRVISKAGDALAPDDAPLAHLAGPGGGV